METKTQRNARLLAMRKKYHLGEFRREKHVSHSIKSHRRVNMARKKRARAKSGVSSSSLMSTALGVGGYLVYESFLQPKLAAVTGTGVTLNVVELAAGVYLSRKGGVLGSVGKTAIVLNAYQLLANIVRPMILGAPTSSLNAY